MTAWKALKTYPGFPFPMGVNRAESGRLNFAAALPGEGEKGIELYPEDGGETVRLPFSQRNRVGEVYCMQLEGLPGTGFRYNYYSGTDVITDPFARVIYGNEQWGERVSLPLQSGYSDAAYDWGEDQAPLTPLSDTILYLVHPRGYTMREGSGVKHRGTFAGLMEKIPYLCGLGITAVELMPSYEYLEREDPDRTVETLNAAAVPDATGSAMRYGQPCPLGSGDKSADFGATKEGHDRHPRLNYWGYKRGYYLAPKASYAASEDPVREFKCLVSAMHAAGLEVILQFYFPEQAYANAAPEILRFWLLEYHVDGFHLKGEGIPFARLAQDPVFARTKLFYQGINESEVFGYEPVYGSAGQHAYRHLASYHDGFRNSIRRFLKGEDNTLSAALDSLRQNGRRIGTVNYVANYSGFTLADMVSYNRKHNDANGEGNRDGENTNYSWNCGTEGETENERILTLRTRQMKNALLLLFTAQGTPMLMGGDEFGFSRGGNNNPYCQDNETNWLDWSLADRNRELLDFTVSCIRLRRSWPILHREQPFVMTDPISCGYPDLSYHGREAWRLDPEWQMGAAGLMLVGRYETGKVPPNGDFLYLAYNLSGEDDYFALPVLPGGLHWRIMEHTGACGLMRPGEQLFDKSQKDAEPDESGLSECRTENRSRGKHEADQGSDGSFRVNRVWTQARSICILSSERNPKAGKSSRSKRASATKGKNTIG